MITRYRKANHVVERQVRDKLILVPMRTGPARLDALYTLNETAAFLWQQLGTLQTEDALVAGLMMNYSLAETTAKPDVRHFLDALLAIGAVNQSEQD